MFEEILASFGCDNRVLPSTHGVGRTSPKHSRHWSNRTPTNYGDCESIEELHHLQARFDSFVTEATAAFEAGEEWAADGAKTAASWLSARCRVSRAAAKRRVRLGRTLRHLPAVAEAWRDGAIGGDQAQAIASARRHRTESSMARDEEMLVAQATEMGFDDFSRVLDYWKQLADPDGAEASDEERKASRDVFLEIESRRACGWAR